MLSPVVLFFVVLFAAVVLVLAISSAWESVK